MKKTKTLTPAALVGEIERLSAELAEANADVALLRRLKDAEARAATLSAALGKAQEQLAEANADAHEAARNARFAGFDDISVRDNTPEEHVLRTAFTITVNRMAYDSDTRTSTLRPLTFSGFIALPGDAYAYLIERKPSAIPAKIMALAPGDPAEAMRRYLLAMRRGYVEAAAA